MTWPYKVREASDAEWGSQCVCSPSCGRGVTRVLHGPRKDGTTVDLPYCEFHFQTLALMLEPLGVSLSAA